MIYKPRDEAFGAAQGSKGQTDLELESLREPNSEKLCFETDRQTDGQTDRTQVQVSNCASKLKKLFSKQTSFTSTNVKLRLRFDIHLTFH